MVFRFNKNHKPPSGFTLIEVITAIFVFSVVLFIVGNAFVDALSIQRRALNLQQAEENANFVLEFMAKEIRVSEVVSPDSGCPAAPAATLSINHPVNGSVTYSLAGGNVHRNVNGIDTIINSNTVEFTRLQFCIAGSTVNDDRQPRITVLLGAQSVNPKERAAIDIQTSLSQRFLSD